MWQFVLNRALVLFAQTTSGAPSVPTGMPAPGTEGVASAAPQAGFHHTVWHTILLFIYFLICLGLVLSVLLQTTKSEGLSGIIGGSTQSVFKGKKGFEEQLQTITNYLAVGFMVMSMLVTFLAFKTK